MALPGKVSRLLPQTGSDQTGEAELCDLRFRGLLSEREWQSLPEATRRRFTKRLADGNTAIYVGEVDEVRFSRIGWWLAQLARAIGGPLPTGTETSVPSIVTVTEDAATGGQIWTRLYARRDGFPQVIHSSKRFAGPTGLEEHVGYGVGMELDILVEHGALRFQSAGYFLQLGRLRLTLPRLLTPGVLTVTHADLGTGAFRFTLDIRHPRFGNLIHQSAVFRETAP